MKVEFKDQVLKPVLIEWGEVPYGAVVTPYRLNGQLWATTKDVYIKMIDPRTHFRPHTMTLAFNPTSIGVPKGPSFHSSHPNDFLYKVRTVTLVVDN